MCGGFDEKTSTDLKKCYKYSPAADTWTEVGEMPKAARLGASSSHPKLGLIMTGM